MDMWNKTILGEGTMSTMALSAGFGEIWELQEGTETGFGMSAGNWSASNISCQKIKAIELALGVEINRVILLLSHWLLCAGKALCSQSKKTS